MNISNLSQETLSQLVELAIASSPTKAAYILLNNETIVSPTAAVKVVEKKRKEAFDNILFAVSQKDKIKAIREFRTVSGCGLKESKDIIEMAFPKLFGKSICDGYSVSTENYWVRALQKYADSKELILG